MGDGNERTGDVVDLARCIMVTRDSVAGFCELCWRQSERDIKHSTHQALVLARGQVTLRGRERDQMMVVVGGRFGGRILVLLGTLAVEQHVDVPFVDAAEPPQMAFVNWHTCINNAIDNSD